MFHSTLLRAETASEIDYSKLRRIGRTTTKYVVT